MSKFSFEKGQKAGLIEDEDPQKEEILKIVVKKLIKKHLKGGVTDQQLNDAFNSVDPGDPKTIFFYKQLKEAYDAERKKKPIKTPEPTEVKVIPVIDIIEEKEKEEIKELNSQKEKLVELKKAIPIKVAKVTINTLRKDIEDSEYELNEKRNKLYRTIEKLTEKDYKKRYVIDDEYKRRELDHKAFLLKQQIDIIKDQLTEDREKLEELEIKNKNIENLSSNIDKELNAINIKLKIKDETKRKLEEKAESKRKNTEESINQSKLQLKQKSLFPNIQKLRDEKDQQDKIKNKKKKLKK